MTDAAAFVRWILEEDNLGAGALVLADWLDERSDPRGRLLRLRHRRWQRDLEQVRAQVNRTVERVRQRVLQSRILCGLPTHTASEFYQATEGPVAVYWWRDRGWAIEGADKMAQILSRRVDHVFRRYLVERFVRCPETQPRRWSDHLAGRAT